MKNPYTPFFFEVWTSYINYGLPHESDYYSYEVLLLYVEYPLFFNTRGVSI